ncbi:MAG: penicillin-binding protein 2 [Propionibacterium sp.]|nr:penicillin-binding protein 2 [Propionibacterium sp.]
MSERKRPSSGGSSRKRTSSSSGKRTTSTSGKRPAKAKRYVDTPRVSERRYRRSASLKLGNTAMRLRVFLIVVALLLGTAGVRAFQLQALDQQAFAAEAAAKMQTTRDVAATRGAISDRNGVVLAETEPGMMVFVDPDMIQTNGADKRYEPSQRKLEEAAQAPGAVADILVEHLGGRKTDYLEIFERTNEKTGKYSRYEVVARKVPSHTFTKIQGAMRAGLDGEGKQPLYGVFGESDPIRVYPNRSTGSNVVGFVNAAGVGASGLEYALQEHLSGEDGKATFDRSTYGRIPLGTNIMVPAVDGVDYEVTIDSDLQWMTDQMLAEGVKNSGSATGTAVAMNVHTGEVLALSVLPTFDSSNPGRADSEDLGNRAVTEAFEPGSTQKVLTFAALADAGLVTPDTKVQVPSRIASGGGFVRDAYEHGTINLTARGIMANSSNIGTIQLTRQMDKSDLSEYLASFGLGSRSGIELPGETSGRLPGVDMPDYTRDQISFGQGLSVNAVQMAAAVASVVNGGTYHQPRILKSATDAEGQQIALPEPESRTVISEEASRMVVEMMEAVTMLDEDNRAIPGYRTAGKSGTAQRYDPDCSCYNGFTASYVAVAPAEDPQILVYVVLDQPTNGNLGSRLALPVVNHVLRIALPRYNVLPSTSEAPREALTFE